MFELKMWIDTWARAVGMPIGRTDDDEPVFVPLTQKSAKKALAFRTFWIALHIITCIMIIAGNSKILFAAEKKLIRSKTKSLEVKVEVIDGRRLEGFAFEDIVIKRITTDRAGNQVYIEIKNNTMIIYY